MDRINVLYVSNGSSIGGAENSLLDMLKGILDRNIRPVVIIPSCGIIEEKLKGMNIVYYIVPFSNGYGKIGDTTKEDRDNNFCDNYLAALKLQDIIKKENINLIHINSSVSNVGAFAALMAGIPYVWHIRELLEEDFDCEFWDKLLKIKLMKNANSIITISKCVQETYKSKYNLESVQIYNGLDIDKYIDDVEMHLYNKTNNFIITGRVTENKGQWDAIKAVEKLISEGITDIHLTILGAGKTKFVWALKHYVENNGVSRYVDIQDFTDELDKYRKNSTYALTTSRMEALGRCTIEAMLTGNIVIGANTGGTKELIGIEQNKGFLYNQGDYESLATMMKQALELSANEKGNILKNAQKYAIDTFSLTTYCEKLIDLYEIVLKTKKEKKVTLELLKELECKYNKLNSGKVLTQEYNKNKELSKKNSPYMELISKWEQLLNAGHSIREYFTSRKIHKIAIYGMGQLGCKLYDELNSKEIQILYVVDREDKYISEVLEVKHPDEDLKEIDMLVVSVSKEEEKLVKYYRSKFPFKVIGLSGILDEMLDLE